MLHLPEEVVDESDLQDALPERLAVCNTDTHTRQPRSNTQAHHGRGVKAKGISPRTLCTFKTQDSLVLSTAPASWQKRTARRRASPITVLACSALSRSAPISMLLLSPTQLPYPPVYKRHLPYVLLFQCDLIPENQGKIEGATYIRVNTVSSSTLATLCDPFLPVSHSFPDAIPRPSPTHKAPLVATRATPPCHVTFHPGKSVLKFLHSAC